MGPGSSALEHISKLSSYFLVDLCVCIVHLCAYVSGQGAALGSSSVGLHLVFEMISL